MESMPLILKELKGEGESKYWRRIKFAASTEIIASSYTSDDLVLWSSHAEFLWSTVKTLWVTQFQLDRVGAAFPIRDV